MGLTVPLGVVLYKIIVEVELGSDIFDFRRTLCWLGMRTDYSTRAILVFSADADVRHLSV